MGKGAGDDRELTRIEEESAKNRPVPQKQ